MLISTNKVAEGKRRPVFNMWYGNFFEPYYSQKEFHDRGVKDLAEMGFNAISLDSKLWKDFQDFYKGEAPSQYVEMQLHAAKLCEEHGMGLTYLSLFNSGDNLYPKIRTSPPVFVEQPVDENGNLIRGYRHWSQKQIEAQAEHCGNLYKYIGPNCKATAIDENGNPRKPFYCYHSPNYKQSFDEDGQVRYRKYLADIYQSVEKLNEEYKTTYTSFDEIKLQDVWLNQKEMEDVSESNPEMRIYRDNQLYKWMVMDDSMERLVAELYKQDPEYYIYGCMSQWKYLMNNWIFINSRGLNLWNMGKHFDCPTFYTMPSDAFGRANAFVVPAEMAILRSACKHEDLSGGLFVGRYLWEDIYATVSIGETIASAYGSGCKDLIFYGYNGLDDGGNFGKWSKEKKLATRRAFDWFTEINEITGKRIKEKKAAIIFPMAAFTMIDLEVFPESIRRYQNDFSGWYKQLSDCGINADVLNPEQVVDQAADYEMIIIPANPYYEIMKDEKMELALRNAVENGTKVFVSGDTGIFDAFDIKASEHEDDSIIWKETITEFSNKFFQFENAEELACYVSSKATAIAKKELGKGTVFAFGFDYGACYCESRQKEVPVRYGAQAHYPLTVLDVKPFEVFTGLKITDGIEIVPFENGVLYINHTSYSYKMPENKEYLHLEENATGNTLFAHTACFVQ